MPDSKTRLRRARLIHTMREVDWRDKAAAFADAQKTHDHWQNLSQRLSAIAQDYGNADNADTAHMLISQRTMARDLSAMRVQAEHKTRQAAVEIGRKRAALSEASERRKASDKATKSAEQAARKFPENKEIPQGRKAGTVFE